MTIDLLENKEGGYWNIAVYNLLGQEVYAVKNQLNSPVVLKKDMIGKGLFIAKINQGQNVITKRLVFEWFRLMIIGTRISRM